MNAVQSPREFLTLDGLDQLDDLVARSCAVPVLVFKHSDSCGTSAQAYDELMAYLQGAPAAVAIHLVEVHEGREIARAIASRFGVRHESPQLQIGRAHV